MINTHEKLMELLFYTSNAGNDIAKTLITFGFKGAKKQVPGMLVVAMSETDAYIHSSQDVLDPDTHITTDEYFEMLARVMNRNL